MPAEPPSDLPTTASGQPTADASPDGHPQPAQPAHHRLGERPGDFIGPYKLLDVIGEGGFGTVFLAERREPMVQRAALKVIKPGMDTRAVIARFEQERQALAVMDHPNVAKVLDGGVTPTGRPYFVMEHVKGEPITEFCDRHRLTIRQRLELFIPVCEAVQHAHMKGIIHRDLKPSNILVGITGDSDKAHGAPTTRGMLVKVIDFGVAKAISHTLTDKTIFTEQGMIIGTPEYMSPEQAEMGATDIDTRTDVYSLGVVLYELLSGTLPFDSASLRSAGYAEIQRIIREVDAPRPSTRLSTADDATGAAIAKARQSEREQIAAELRRELDWIPLKAIRKDRAARYESARDLARDVCAYLSGQMLDARPETSRELILRLLRRHPGRVLQLMLGFSLVYAILILPFALSLSATRTKLIQSSWIADQAFRHGLLWGREADAIANSLALPTGQWAGTDLKRLASLYDEEHIFTDVHELLVRFVSSEHAAMLAEQSEERQIAPNWEREWQEILRTRSDSEIRDAAGRSLMGLILESHWNSYPVLAGPDPQGSWLYFTNPEQLVDPLVFGDVDRAPYFENILQQTPNAANRLRELEKQRLSLFDAIAPSATSLAMSRFWLCLLVPPAALAVASLYLCFAGAGCFLRRSLLALLVVLAAISGASIPLTLAGVMKGNESTAFLLSSVVVAAVGMMMGWIRGRGVGIIVFVGLVLGALAMALHILSNPYKIHEIVYILDGV